MGNASELNCKICDSSELLELPEYSRLARVTSDCKAFAPGGRLAVCERCGAVQKPVDRRWEDEIASIYRNYEPYFQSGGIEQAVFDASLGEPQLRSMVVLNRLAATRGLARTGAVLDVGCGNGVLLSAFAKLRPDWQLYGHEQSDLHAGELFKIDGFEELFTGPLGGLPRQFDAITMMHALEHLAGPREALAELREKIAPEGFLFIEVPNVAATPYDILIADHASHFTRQDLARLFEKAGYGAAVIADDWVTKELSAVATPNGTAVPMLPAAPPAQVINRVKGQIAWLEAVMAGARAAASQKRRFGLFGSSIAAMWLFGQLGDAVSFFVDEDPSRRNTTLFGRPVLTPAEAPRGALVYMALIPAAAEAVAKRLAASGIEFRLPPDLSSRMAS
jgi:SAM-dependent methyltransferase